MRTVIYWPWDWTRRVWVRMAGVAGFMALFYLQTEGVILLSHYVEDTYGVKDLWGYGGLIWFGGFMLVGFLAIVWGFTTITITQQEGARFRQQRRTANRTQVAVRR